MKTRTTVAVATAILMVSMLFIVIAQANQAPGSVNQPMMSPAGAGSGPGMEMGPGMVGHHARMLEMFRRELNLSDDQVRRIHAIHEEWMRENSADMTRARELHRQLVDIMKEPGTTRTDDALAVWRDLDVIHDRLARSGIRAMFEAKSVLTVDQQRRLSALIDERMNKMRTRMGTPAPTPPTGGGFGRGAEEPLPPEPYNNF